MSSPGPAVDPVLLPHERPCWCEACKAAYRRAYYRSNLDRWRQYGERRYEGKSTPVSYGQCAADDCDRCWVITSNRNRARKWCSTRCRDRQRYRDRVGTAALHVEERQCLWCFALYVNKQRRVLYCGPKCSAAALRHWKLHRHPHLCLLPMCRRCARPTGSRVQGNAYWCDECSREMKPPKNPASDRAKSARRRGAVVRGEKFSINDLIARDGIDCKLCGQPVRMDVHYLNTLYGTIDHIVPIAVGGEHSLANCQVAHRSCNSSKGARHVGDPVQLRLV